MVQRIGIRIAMKDNPRKRRCSCCGERVHSALRGVVAVVCSKCIQARVAGPEELQDIREETKIWTREDAKQKRRELRGLPLIEAAEQVLREHGEPMKTDALTEKMIGDGIWKSRGDTPAASVYAGILMDIRNRGDDSPFERTAPSTWGIKKK